MKKTKSGVRSVAAPLGARAMNKRDKQARIAKAAWDLFTTQGFAQTSTSEVAARAGVATGTLFLYAPDKDELLFLVMHERLEAVSTAAIDAKPPKGSDVAARLAHVFTPLFRLYAQSGDVGRHFVRALPGASGPNAQRVNALTLAFLHRLAALLVDAQRGGEVRTDVDAMLAVQTVFGLYFSTLMAWLSGITTAEAMPATLGAMLRLFVEGLAPHRRAR